MQHRTRIAVVVLLALSTQPSIAQEIDRVLFRDLTYWSGPLTLHGETASFLLARRDGTGAEGPLANIPKQAIAYVTYAGHAVPYEGGERQRRVDLRRRSQRTREPLLYPSAALVAFGLYEWRQYRAADRRVDKAARNGLPQLARAHRETRTRNLRLALVSAVVGAFGVATALLETIPVLTFGDGTVVALHPGGRYTVTVSR